MIRKERNTLPKSWTTSPLSELLIALESGSRPRGGVKHIKTGIPSVGAEHLDNNSGFKFKNVKFVPKEFVAKMRRGHIQKGDILIVKDGATTGKTSLVRGSFPYPEAVINEHVFKCRCTDDVDSKYIFYFLFSADGNQQILKDFRGAAQGGISQRFVEIVTVPIAPFNEQKRIVAEIEKQFSRLDEATAAMKRIKENLKRYKASVLKAAVEGKLTEEWRKAHPDVEPASELLKRILTERRRKWEEENSGKKYNEPVEPKEFPDTFLPESWDWVIIDQLSVIVRGASPRPAGDPKYFGGIIPWITVGELTKDDNVYLNEVSSFVTEEGRKASRYIESGTFLLTNSGATLGVPKITNIGGCINDGSVALLYLDETVKLYLYYFFTRITRKLRQINQGAAQPNLNTTIVRNIAVPLPPFEEQLQIISEVQQQLSIIEEIYAAIDGNLKRAERFSQSILKKAFSGKLVPQDPNDEPASVLLERILQDRKKKELKKEKAKEDKYDRKKMKGVVMVKKVIIKTRPLLEVLNEQKDKLTPEELLLKAGHSVDSIDDFYAELKKEIEKNRIKQLRPNNKDVYLKAVSK